MGNSEKKILSDRQQALIRFIQDLDPERRHSIQVECRGAEPWNITEIKEHINIRVDKQ